MNHRALGILGALMLAGLACTTLLGSPGTELGESASPTLFPPQEPSGELLFQDDFSDPSTGWEVGNYGTGSVGYQFDAYVVESAGGGSTMWGLANRTFDDVIVEVEAEQVSAPPNDNNDYGVMCRVQENSDGYFLLIAGDGRYAILKRVQGGFEALVGWSSSSAIRQGDATNSIRAACVDSSLALAVNGEQIAEVEDATFTSGDLALTATSYEPEATTVHFDGLRVFQP